MKSMLSHIRWAIACLMAPLIVAFHRLGKPQGFEVFNVISGTTFNPSNLMSHDDEPGWKVVRLPFTDAAGALLANMKAGFVVKMDATATAVLGALAADDAALAGVIIDLPETVASTTDKSVAVALNGSFDKRTVKYADGSPLSVAAITRLRDMNIFLDDTVPTGAFSP